jgi:Flp pilus assembly protein TadB
VYVYVGAVLSILLLVGLACFCWQRVQMKKQRKLERVERQMELKLSMDEKLVKALRCGSSSVMLKRRRRSCACRLTS